MVQIASDFYHDICYSLRSLWRDRVFSATAIVALTLGIGLSIAIYSVVKTTLLDPLPYPNGKEIVQFLIVNGDESFPNASVPKFAMWRQLNTLFTDISGYNPRAPAANVTSASEPSSIRVEPVTHDFFHLFGAPIELGRAFTEDEDKPGGQSVVIISHGVWLNFFNGASDVLGRTLEISGVARSIVGVMGADFAVDPPPDAWIPFQFDLNSADHFQYFVAAGRLRSGMTIGMARSQLKSIELRFRERFPGVLGPRNGFSAAPLQEVLAGDVRASLILLTSAVGLVMLIASGNVATLLLLRGIKRNYEMAVRSALGAVSSRLVRQLLAESIVLFSISGFAGALAGLFGLKALLTLHPDNFPNIMLLRRNISVDWQLLGFAFTLSSTLAFICGVIPALAASRVDVASILKSSGGRTGSGRGYRSTSFVLVVGQLAVTGMLLLGASLLTRSFLRLSSVDIGFRPQNVLTVQMSLPGVVSSGAAALIIEHGIQRIQAFDFVNGVAVANALPLESRFDFRFSIPGRAWADSRSSPLVGWTAVSPAYFEVNQIPLHQGRLFDLHDNFNGQPVAIINQTMKDRYWPNTNPVGQSVEIDLHNGPRSIIGIVGDIRDESIALPPRPSLYVPIGQVPDKLTATNARIRPFHWFIRARDNANNHAKEVQRELAQVSRMMPVSSPRTMDGIVAKALSGYRFRSLLLNVFVFCALLLSGIGVYAVLAYSVEFRKKELGIRMCLGAPPASLRNLILVQGFWYALVGSIVAQAGILVATPILNSLLYGISPWDPWAVSAAPALIGVLALGSALVPASRASRMNAISAVRD